MGAKAGEVPEKSRSASQEIGCSEADVASNEEEDVGFDEGSLGCEEEGWGYVSIAQ